VSNIIVLQRADDLKIEISFRDYARLGVPVTLVSLGVVLVWTSLMA
jgi:Na+/H+ antiporter NhaD/arsenite permease-like protein